MDHFGRCVSVIVVTWNNATSLDRLDRSLWDHSGQWIHEILVQDNGSVDGSADMVKCWARTQLLEGRSNFGFASGVNRALAVATGSVCFIINPDIHFDCDLLGLCLQALEATNPAVISPAIVDRDGVPDDFAARRLPTLCNQIVRHVGLRGNTALQRLGWSETYPPSMGKTPRRVEFASGAAIMAETSIIRSLGGFRTDLPMYFEDLDFSQRCRQAGVPLYQVPTAVAVHEGGVSSSQVKGDLMLMLENAAAPWTYFNVHRGRWYASAYRVMIGILAAVQVASARIAKSAVHPGSPELGVRHRRASAMLKWALRPSIVRSGVRQHFHL